MHMQLIQNTEYTVTHTNTNESMHSEMGPMWQNPIQTTVRTTHLSMLMSAQLQYTIQHRTVLITSLLPPDKHHSSDVVRRRSGGILVPLKDWM